MGAVLALSQAAAPRVCSARGAHARARPPLPRAYPPLARACPPLARACLPLAACRGVFGRGCLLSEAAAAAGGRAGAARMVGVGVLLCAAHV